MALLLYLAGILYLTNVLGHNVVLPVGHFQLPATFGASSFGNPSSRMMDQMFDSFQSSGPALHRSQILSPVISSSMSPLSIVETSSVSPFGDNGHVTIHVQNIPQTQGADSGSFVDPVLRIVNQIFDGLQSTEPEVKQHQQLPIKSEATSEDQTGRVKIGLNFKANVTSPAEDTLLDKLRRLKVDLEDVVQELEKSELSQPAGDSRKVQEEDYESAGHQLKEILKWALDSNQIYPRLQPLAESILGDLDDANNPATFLVSNIMPYIFK